MTAQAMVDLLVYFLLVLWGTSVVLLLMAMMGYDVPQLRIGSLGQTRPADRHLRLVHYRPGLAMVPSARPRRPIKRAPQVQAAIPRPRPTHLRVVGM